LEHRLASRAPARVAFLLASLIPEEKRGSYRVLDLAAGTGRVGQSLVKEGFKNIEALGK